MLNLSDSERKIFPSGGAEFDREIIGACYDRRQHAATFPPDSQSVTEGLGHEAARLFNLLAQGGYILKTQFSKSFGAYLDILRRPS